MLIYINPRRVRRDYLGTVIHDIAKEKAHVPQYSGPH